MADCETDKFVLSKWAADLIKRPVEEAMKRVDLVNEMLMQRAVGKTEGGSAIVNNLSFRKIASDIAYIRNIYSRILTELTDTCSFRCIEEVIVQGRTEQEAKKEYIALYQGRKWKLKQFEKSDRSNAVRRHISKINKQISNFCTEKGKVITSLEEEIESAKLSNPQWESYERKLSEVRSENLKFRLDQKEEELHDTLMKLNKELPNENKAHETIVYYLTKACENLRSELKSWKSKYDEDDKSMKEKLKVWQEDIAAREAELAAVREEHDGYEEVVKEYEVEMQRRQVEKRETEKKFRAAVVIQSRWRGFNVRRTLATTSRRKLKKKNKK